jgi:hypothetical protein
MTLGVDYSGVRPTSAQRLHADGFDVSCSSKPRHSARTAVLPGDRKVFRLALTLRAHVTPAAISARRA